MAQAIRAAVTALSVAILIPRILSAQSTGSAGQPVVLVNGTTVTVSFTPATPAPQAYVITATWNGAPIGPFHIGSATTASAAGVAPGSYVIQVVAVHPAGSVTSPATSFQIVDTRLPIAPEMSAPVVAGTTVSLGWSAVTGATGYELEAVVLATGQTLTIPVANQSTASFANVPTGTFRVRLRARNGFGLGPYSNAATLSVPGSVVSIQQLIQLYSSRVNTRNVLVASTMGDAFSQAHASHAQLVWNYFSTLFARSVGPRTEMYYTNDLNLYSLVFQFCPSIVIPGARRLTTCYDSATGIYQWFIVPYITPDFGTQLHELSHSFLYATYLGAEDFPWIKEGTGMYWESGVFDHVGQLQVALPLPYLTTHFRQWYNAGQLVPLATLLTMPRLTFYGSEPTKVYSQSGMFVYFLMKNYSAVMAELFNRLNNRTIANNVQVIAFLTGQTGLTVAQMEAAYIAYGLRF
jgi:hypothetical protein